jgi:hypothetical protein
MSARTQATLWIAVAVALFAWAVVEWSIFKPVLGGLAAVYGVLLLVKTRIIEQRVALSQEELGQWGDKLSEATPVILELLGKSRHVSVIARAVKKSHQIPEDITLKYIIALGKYQKDREGKDRIERAG